MGDHIIQALAVILLCWGLWETGNGRVRGPILAALAEIFVIIVGVTHETWSVALIGVIIFLVQDRNAYLWIKQGKPL